MHGAMLILLVEDDEDLGRAVGRALEEEGFGVHWAKTGDEGLYRATDWDYDLVILDRMLPGLEGIELLRRLRARGRVPVLMLTALNRLSDRIEGLNGGADDYLGKPFELTELFARARALLRRSSQWNQAGLAHGDVRLDPIARRVFKGEAEVALTASELATVELLLARKGRTVSKQVLEDRLGREGVEINSNSLKVHIHRIGGNSDGISSARGAGLATRSGARRRPVRRRAWPSRVPRCSISSGGFTRSVSRRGWCCCWWRWG